MTEELRAPVVHATAEIEAGVHLGAGTAVWAQTHVRGPGTTLGDDCIVGERTYIAYGVAIGDRVKINAGAYLCMVSLSAMA